MKKTCLILLCILAVNSAFSQTEIGFQAGINRSRFWGKEFYQKYHSAATGFSFRGVFRKGISDHFSLATGLSYERTGSRINDIYFSDALGINTPKGDLVFELDYLAIPFTANYNFGKNKAFGLGAGFFTGYLLTAKNRFHYESDNTGFPEKSSNKDHYENFNFGLVANACYRLHFSKNKFLAFSIEDHLGLSNVSQQSDEKMKTNSVGFFVSFLLDLNK